MDNGGIRLSSHGGVGKARPDETVVKLTRVDEAGQSPDTQVQC